MPLPKQFQRSVYHLLLRSFIEILRLTNLETESSKQRTQDQHKWYTISLRKLAVECLKCAVLYFIFVSSFSRPKMDVTYQMSQICQAADVTAEEHHGKILKVNAQVRKFIILALKSALALNNESLSGYFRRNLRSIDRIAIKIKFENVSCAVLM